ncbi:hypothetical protein OH77DRAFT_1207987 [Trametes cingulata]|nr:hypothetical protein OH77DRAFT_1207987 [Trametes cingulata]
MAKPASAPCAHTNSRYFTRPSPISLRSALASPDAHHDRSQALVAGLGCLPRSLTNPRHAHGRQLSRSPRRAAVARPPPRQSGQRLPRRGSPRETPPISNRACSAWRLSSRLALRGHPPVVTVGLEDTKRHEPPNNRRTAAACVHLGVGLTAHLCRHKGSAAAYGQLSWRSKPLRYKPETPSGPCVPPPCILQTVPGYSADARAVHVRPRTRLTVTS